MNDKMLVETINGNIVDLMALSYNTLTVKDVVKGLNHINRFNGRARQSKGTITVLEHSYAMYRFMREVLKVDHNTCLYALMHDAHEALVGDIVSPLSSMMGEFGKFLNCVQRRVLERFFVTPHNIEEVKRVDRLACAVEWGEFVAESDDVLRRNGIYYGHSPKLVEHLEYGQYLMILNEVHRVLPFALEGVCCSIIYEHVAESYLSSGA